MCKLEKMSLFVRLVKPRKLYQARIYNVYRHCGVNSGGRHGYQRHRHQTLQVHGLEE